MKLKLAIFFGAFTAITTFAAYADDMGLSSEFQKFIGNTNPDKEDWSFHAQATEIIQGYPSFPSSYSGPNSLASPSQVKNTTSATLFIGRRLWEGAAVYYNPELYEGKGLSDTHGVAGFPNGEGSKSGSWGYKTNDARLFIRQVIGLGGPQEKIDAEQNQLADKEDISRITFTAGKFAAADIFDNNTYDHDPRTQFLNWSILESAAWDYPGNSRGYTNGAVAEFNQMNWTLRYGMFMEPDEPNQSNLVFHGANNIAQITELEDRYKISDNPGKARLLLFYNRTREASYSDALGAPDVNLALANARDWGGVKYGFVLNIEQQLADGVGAFTRLSWNNGRTEEWMYAQVDESAVIGLSVDGKRWSREGDNWSIAGVINGISADQQAYLAQGGLGLTLGDGMLSYRPEMILETFYLFKITSYAALSPDYQFIANPGYNADRGPVNVFTARLHLNF